MPSFVGSEMCIRDSPKLDTGPLGDADNRDAPQHGAMITALVAAGTPAFYQSFRLIKMDGGNGDAAATRNLANRQAVFKYGIFHAGSGFLNDLRS